MVVRTDSEAALELRKAVLEPILAEHPADCFNFRLSGTCRLHELATRHGLAKVSNGIERSKFPVDDSNPFFTPDPNRRILCDKCVRICAEIQCSDVYTFADRGCRSSVAPGFGDLLADSRCVSCGSCLSACPTGALRPKDVSWAGAIYVDRRVRTVCSYCGVGCQMELLV